MSTLCEAYLDEALDIPDLEAFFDARAELVRVRAVLEGMPEAQRRIVELALVEGLSHEEIGRRLGIDPENVRARVFRARARLRALEGRGRLRPVRRRQRREQHIARTTQRRRHEDRRPARRHAP